MFPSYDEFTNSEYRLASLAAASALPENHFSMNRHPPTRADFDKGNVSCQGRTSLDGDLLMTVAEPILSRYGRCIDSPKWRNAGPNACHLA